LLAQFKRRAQQGDYLMFIYRQSDGLIWAPDCKLLGYGYSGAPDAKNDGAQEHKPFIGPIPLGVWSIDGWYDSDTLGPNVIILHPYRHDAHGRTFFRIHGDSRSRPGDASKGCIVLAPGIRERIINECQESAENQWIRVVQ
jgi:hypothetical protein